MRWNVDVRTFREWAERKDKSPTPKLMSLDEAVKKFLRNGAVVAIGGCLYSRTPMAAVHEIIRQGFRELTIVRNLAGFETDLLLVSGCLRRLVTSWCSPGYAWGMSRVLRHYVENALAEFEEWSHLGIGLRLKAAAMGVPFLPTFSMLGSSIMERLGIAEMTCPYSGEKLALVPALYPDVAIIHANRADAYGNIQIDGYTHMDKDMAQAARHVIATVEEVVDGDEIRRSAERTIIPFFCVDAVVELPFGAYPSECWGRYEADFSHIASYQQRVDERGIEGARSYVSENITGVSSFMEFLSKVGVEQLLGRVRAFRNVVA